MLSFHALFEKFGAIAHSQITLQQLEELRDNLKQVKPDEITSLHTAQQFLSLLRKFREGVAEADKLHGENYPQLLNSLLSVGEDGLYSNNLRFVFELIQNVDDCEFPDSSDHSLEIHFDFNHDRIILRYNEKGFTPFNVFAITGIAEAAKNVASGKNEIGEKGIGFKSVFGVTDVVLIRSGWFSFELHKDNFTIPVANYRDESYCTGTEMTLFVSRGKAQNIYHEIKQQYCTPEALFRRNPMLFLNKLTSLKMYYDCFRALEFHVSRSQVPDDTRFYKEDNVCISVDLHDYENGYRRDVEEKLICTRYTYNVLYSDMACKSRYGPNTKVGIYGGKPMALQVVFPHPEYLKTVSYGALYSFLPTQLKFSVPIVCHVPFKLDASREFIDPQGGNLWFQKSCEFLSELLDYAYQDWAYTVKNDILSYIPAIAHNIFRENNGKEKCVSSQSCFMGRHFLNLPVFYTTNKDYLPADKIFCFDPEEQISEPEAAYKLLSPALSLFIPPQQKQPQHYGIRTEHNIYTTLFLRAIHSPNKTAEILQYLAYTDFHPTTKDLPAIEFTLTLEQIRLFMQYDKFAALFMDYSKECLAHGKRPPYSVIATNIISVREALYQEFKVSEAPKLVEKYLGLCQEACVTLSIRQKQYLPCRNALILSDSNPMASFSALCYAVDSRDTFSVRMRHREISERLNLLSESNDGTAQDYLRELRNNRLLGRDAIGMRQYQNYIDLILRAGTTPGRFIQELLQNADDCEYDDDVVPEFILTQEHNKIHTQYNERGFTRGNIRAITAIGESTKNLLLNQNISQIGEKGVGFKTIFSIASTVQVHSGDYHFMLHAKAPTIPEFIDGENENIPGTKMELTLKNNASLTPFTSERDVLELCLCLRKLRRLQINGTQVTIDDTGEVRTVTINRHPHQFRRFVYPFTLNQEALAERENGLRSISPNQKIVCYVPEKSAAKDYPLYSGLPTKHRIKIPMVIDAPFMLTTSREEIETGTLRWNGQVRAAVYAAILSVIHELKQAERHKALRFLRFVPRRQGMQTIYINDLFSCEFLNNYNFLPIVKAAEILPTYDPNIFVSSNSRAAMRYPEALRFLFSANCFGILEAGEALDIPAEESLDSTLNALGCPEAPFSRYFTVIRQYTSAFIKQEEFRSNLYMCLQGNAQENYKESLRDLPLIPVYRTDGKDIEFIPWEDDAIFVKRGTYRSGTSYYILNEDILSKTSCERILGVNINEMNAEWERSRYNDELRDIIKGSDMRSIYDYLLTEFSKDSFDKYQSWEILIGMRDMIPIKNQLGDLVDREIFICEEVTGYFQSKLVRSISIHDECKTLAARLRYPVLSQIHYQDIYYKDSLTYDDLDDLTTDYFINREEILRCFYRNGQLADNLIEEYDLEYILLQTVQDEEQYDFPEKPVRNIVTLKKHVQSLLRNPPRIITAIVERSVKKIHYSSGAETGLDDAGIRSQTLQLYTPEGVHRCCFCQKCLKVKDYSFMEVNNIVENPKYYFPQTHIALCLECSKSFEATRHANAQKAKHGGTDPFLKAIQEAHVGSSGYVDIPLGKNEKIRFTGTHLAEIQEILRSMPK